MLCDVLYGQHLVSCSHFPNAVTGIQFRGSMIHEQSYRLHFVFIDPLTATFSSGVKRCGLVPGCHGNQNIGPVQTISNTNAPARRLIK